MDVGGAACPYKTGFPVTYALSPCAMTEGSLRSYDPLAYYVNNVSDLDAEVVKAHRDSDEQKRKELLSRGKQDFDIFICVNKHNHAVRAVRFRGPDLRRRAEQGPLRRSSLSDVLEVRAVLRERPAPDLQNTE